MQAWKFAGASMFDNTFASAVFDGQPEVMAHVLRIILENPSINVLTSEAQVYFINGYGHDVWMDVVAVGDDRTGYVFEIQRDK